MANLFGAAVAKIPEPAVDLAPPTARAGNLLKLFFAGTADAHTRSVVAEDLQFLDVVDRLAAHHRMHTAGIVADHAAESAVLVGGRIRRKSQVVLFGRAAELIADHSGLDPRDSFRRIQFQDAVHVLGEIQNDRHIAALSGEAGSATASQNRNFIFPAGANRLNHIFDITGYHHADWHMAVKGEIGCVQRTAAGIETYFAANGVAQLRGQLLGNIHPPSARQYTQGITRRGRWRNGLGSAAHEMLRHPGNLLVSGFPR